MASERPEIRRHVASTPPHMLPAELSWRGTPADSPVQDQAACGSCFAFSASGALDAAYYRATGRPAVFSAQQLVDCGWEGGMHGCYGGDQLKAFDWVFARGGMAPLAAYPYRGVNDYCRHDAESLPFEGGCWCWRWYCCWWYCCLPAWKEGARGPGGLGIW